MAGLAPGARGRGAVEAGAVLAPAPPRPPDGRATSRAHPAAGYSDWRPASSGTHLPGGLVRIVARPKRPAALPRRSSGAVSGLASERRVRRRSAAEARPRSSRRRSVPPTQPLPDQPSMGSDEQRRRTHGPRLPAPVRSALPAADARVDRGRAKGPSLPAEGGGHHPAHRSGQPQRAGALRPRPGCQPCRLILRSNVNSAVSRNWGTILLWRQTDAAASALGVHLISLEQRDDDAVGGAFEAAVRECVEALIVLGDP